MPGKYVLGLAKNDEFTFNLKAGNSQTLFTSETYKAKKSALAGVESVRKNGIASVKKNAADAVLVDTTVDALAPLTLPLLPVLPSAHGRHTTRTRFHRCHRSP